MIKYLYLHTIYMIDLEKSVFLLLYYFGHFPKLNAQLYKMFLDPRQSPTVHIISDSYFPLWNQGGYECIYYINGQKLTFSDG